MVPASRSNPVPTYRFAPSPTGRLHLGHALSALLNEAAARKNNGRFLLRIEDIDQGRSTEENIAGILQDLRWLGLQWEEPVRQQSRHMADYGDVLARLQHQGLVYPAFLSRGQVREQITVAEASGLKWPRDPDGVPLYPTAERFLTDAVRTAKMVEPHTWRLNMDAALQVAGALTWTETGVGPGGETGTIRADPAAWGDIVIARKEIPTSYNLAVVVDDALQGITTVLRGRDLYHATSVQRLLQVLLGLPEPVYHHHRLILDEGGRKLSKSIGSQSLNALRQAGMSPTDIRHILGMG